MVVVVRKMKSGSLEALAINESIRNDETLLV